MSSTCKLTIYIYQVLSGHQDNAEFALAMCPAEPYVLSGGLKLVTYLLGFFWVKIMTREFSYREG